MGKWKYFEDVRKASSCFDKFTHHDNCPDVTHLRFMEKPDGKGVIFSHLNLSRIRVEKKELRNTKTNFSAYDIINIGDSFLQADEIPFNKTLSYIMQKKIGLKVLQVGASSWSPMPMRRWLETHELKKGVQVNFFTMVNDYTQYYGLTNTFYWKEASESGIFKNNTVKEKTHLSLWETTKKLSFIFSHIFAPPIPETPKNLSVLDIKVTEVKTDCKQLNSLQGNIRESAYNYLEFAFESKCWREETVNSVESNIKDFHLIKEHIESKYKGKVNIFIIPQGWALHDENVLGKQMWYYMMSERTVMTTLGLSKYISEKFPVQNLEPVLKQFQQTSKKKLYFPIDGHWTEHAHKLMGAWLARKKLSENKN